MFGYQFADLYEDNDMDNHPTYPRVSLYGYLDNSGTFRQYGPGGYSHFTEHPAFFPIIDHNTDCNYDGSVEHGWKHICPPKDDEESDMEYDDDDNDNEHDDSDIEYPLAENIPWPDDAGQALGKMDFAIYKLGINKADSSPEDAEDPWRWRSENNQLSTTPEKPWTFPDNTNGARINTAVLREDTDINIIGFPQVIPVGNNYYEGLKVVNAGHVANGKGHAHAQHFDEDLLIVKDADIWFGNSGSSVLDNHGRLAGLVSWFSCIEGFSENIPLQIYPTLQMLPAPPTSPIPTIYAQNYATPMWKICRASQIIKKAAKDTNCNGWIDWIDYIASTRIDFSRFIDTGINFKLIRDFEIPTTVEEIHIHRFDMGQKKVVTETREIPANTYQVAWSDNGDFFYVVKQSNIYSLFKNGTSLGTISSYPPLSGSSMLVKGDDIYLAGGNVVSGVSDQGFINNDDTQYVTKITSNGQNGYNFSGVAAIPAQLEEISIFELGNDIYVAGNTTTNFVVYKLVADSISEFGYSLVPVNASQPARRSYNLAAADGKIIVSGGATMNISSVIGFEVEDYPSEFNAYSNIIMLDTAAPNNWITVADNINDIVLMLSVTAIDDGKLIIVNPFITVENSMQKLVLDLSDIPIDNEDLRVSFEFHPVGFCMAESNGSIAAGIEMSGECVPFTHPWYKSLSAGTTVYSLAGKGNRLYVGTNDSIKIYDISDANTFTQVFSFSTNNAIVYDMEIEGNALFAATSKGLYKLDASDPDELTQTLFVATSSNNQYEIELYDGKVYVGDDYGIKIRDKETLSVLSSANSGAVYDFAIENGEIAMFRSSFLNSGIQFRDAETLVETAYDYTSCYDSEIETYNGKFYLACDNYTYSFEANNGYVYFTQLTGDKRELQEVYTYNGYTYIPDSNTIKLSTHEDVPALCGNGIVEGNEVCDGTPIDCAELNESYVSGIAACNSTCDGYVLDNCTAGNGGDGW